MSDSPHIIYELMQVIQHRRRQPASRSYTSSLLTGGPQAIGAKVLEEASEVVQAGNQGRTQQDRQHLIHESADLVFHLLVLLGYHELDWSDVEQELRRRFGVSGLDEKKSRQPGKRQP